MPQHVEPLEAIFDPDVVAEEQHHVHGTDERVKYGHEAEVHLWRISVLAAGKEQRLRFKAT